jgi:hypothetical protein
MAIGQRCGNLVFFPRFGALCQEKSGNPGEFVSQKLKSWRNSKQAKKWTRSFVVLSAQFLTDSDKLTMKNRNSLSQ